MRTVQSRSRHGYFVADLDLRLTVDEPSWFALRTPPPVADDPQLQEPVEKNEFGGHLFSHTSPIYVQIAGQGVFDVAAARGLVDEMKSNVRQIEDQALFSHDGDRQRVLHVYAEAIDLLERRLAAPGARNEFRGASVAGISRRSASQFPLASGESTRNLRDSRTTSPKTKVFRADNKQDPCSASRS